MMKRFRTDSGNPISELPDEILGDILSHLTLREAIGTSVLSRRWKNVWTYTTGTFDFDFPSKVISRGKDLKAKRKRYIRSLDKVLRAHKCSTIQALKVKFDLNSKHKSYIDSWINFAICKKARRIELNLTQTSISREHVEWNQLYVFPAINGDPNMITTLKLNNVNVTGRTFKYFLSNFVSLEYLCIGNSNCLVLATVFPPCPKLKHIKISGCYYLERLDIYSAPNLTSFYYSGCNKAMVRLRDVPNLSEVSLNGSYSARMADIPISRIHKLKLCLSRDRFPGIYNFPEVKNVKHLELESNTSEAENLLSCISACPNLCRLSIRFSWWYTNYWVQRKQEWQQMESVVIHKCLEEVKFVSFQGTRVEVELVTAILSNAPSLEKIMFDTRKPGRPSYRKRSKEDELEHGKVSARCAKRLARQLCPTARLLVLT
jgi:hypothetical protein